METRFWTKANIVRLSVLVVMALVAITIASLTIAQDIYYGSEGQGMLSFAIVNFSGYLFFLIMPVELAFIYYVSEGANLWTLNGIAIGTALLSQCIDYLIGYTLSSKIINKLIGRNRYKNAETKIRKYGNIIIVLFNALPLSSPVISLSAGMLKHRVKDALFYTFMGLLLKYLILTLIFFPR
jgi:membrane protein YqaA with SNARE-associated domain